MKRIAFEQDGKTQVMRLVDGARLALSVTVGEEAKASENPIPVDRFYRRWPVAGALVEWAETEDEFFDRIMKKDAPPGAVIVDDIPEDRAFRGAWSLDKGRCVVDLDKAKDICHAKRREVRDAEFLPLDREVTIPGKAEEAEAKREQVRAKHADLQEAIDAASTVEALKSIVEGL